MKLPAAPQRCESASFSLRKPNLILNCDLVLLWVTFSKRNERYVLVLQGWQKKLALGCVIPRSGPGCAFTQPRAHLFYHPCALNTKFDDAKCILVVSISNAVLATARRDLDSTLHYGCGRERVSCRRMTHPVCLLTRNGRRGRRGARISARCAETFFPTLLSNHSQEMQRQLTHSQFADSCSIQLIAQSSRALLSPWWKGTQSCNFMIYRHETKGYYAVAVKPRNSHVSHDIVPLWALFPTPRSSIKKVPTLCKLLR